MLSFFCSSKWWCVRYPMRQFVQCVLLDTYCARAVFQPDISWSPWSSAHFQWLVLISAYIIPHRTILCMEAPQAWKARSMDGLAAERLSRSLHCSPEPALTHDTSFLQTANAWCMLHGALWRGNRSREEIERWRGLDSGPPISSTSPWEPGLF